MCYASIMTSTVNQMTAEQITSAALAYNAEYPEAEAEILAGTPSIRVMVSNADRNGWNLNATVVPVVEFASGKMAYAADPTLYTLRHRDGRLSREETARRASRYLGVQGAKVPVKFVAVGLA